MNSKFEALIKDINRELDEYETNVREATQWWESYRQRSKLFRAVKRANDGQEA